MPVNSRVESRLSFGLAFVGGYCDAAGYVLAKTFTGHITGALVLAAIGFAGRDWQAFLRSFLAIAFFLGGSVLILASNRLSAWTRSRFLLPVVMGMEAVLIAAALSVLLTRVTFKFGIFVGCMSLAMGLQNGVFTQAGGIGVHTTYLTGLITSLLKTEAARNNSQAAMGSVQAAGQKAKLLGGISLAFVLGATGGAAMVLWLGAKGLVGATLLLLAIAISLSVFRWRGEMRDVTNAAKSAALKSG